MNIILQIFQEEILHDAGNHGENLKKDYSAAMALRMKVHEIDPYPFALVAVLPQFDFVEVLDIEVLGIQSKAHF
jgi:hypothetical protein